MCTEEEGGTDTRMGVEVRAQWRWACGDTKDGMHALNHHFVDEPGGVVGLLKTPPSTEGCMQIQMEGPSTTSEWVSGAVWMTVSLPACQAKRNGTERISGILRSTTSRSPSRWPRILCILRCDEGSFFVFCLINSEIYNCMQLPSGSIELKEGGNCFTRGLISSTEKNRSTYIWDDVVPSGIPFF